MARVPYREAASLPEDVRPLIRSSLQDRPLHVYRAIANNPAVLQGLRAFLSALWTGTCLTERQRELVVLATARAAGSEYEWHQHVRIASGSLVQPAEIDAIGDETAGPFSAGETALIHYARAVAAGTVDDAIHDAALAAVGDESTLVGAAAVAAGYFGLARLIDAFDVGLEPGDRFVGWAPGSG